MHSLSYLGSFYQNNCLRSVKSSNAGRIRSGWATVVRMGTQQSATLCPADGVLEVYAEQPVDCYTTRGRDYAVESYVVYWLHLSLRLVRYRFLMYWAYPRRMHMRVQNKKCSIIKYAVNIYHSLPTWSSSPCETIGDSGGLVPVVYLLLPLPRM